MTYVEKTLIKFSLKIYKWSPDSLDLYVLDFKTLKTGLSQSVCQIFDSIIEIWHGLQLRLGNQRQTSVKQMKTVQISEN